MRLIKRENASDLILILMISALVTLLTTRFFLYIFGWPTISFGVWHIAHVNWGGALMLVGIILILATHGEKVRRIAAIISGAGWGLFIDEIGKYVTKNNDYWFQPAIIFIYVSFVILYLVYRHFEKSQAQDPKTLLYSVINKLEDINENDFDKNEKKEVLKKLDMVIRSEKDPTKKKFAMDLRIFVQKQAAVEPSKNSWWQQLISKTGYYSYNKIFKRKLVMYGLTVYAGAWSLNRIQETIRILANPQRMQLIQKFYDDYNFNGKADVYMIALKIVSDSIVSLLFLNGIYFFTTKKRKKGLRFFQLGLIVSIFLSSVFKLYFEQFSESIVIITSIALLAGINKLKKETE